jgi:single-strand DNA-binding protein
MNSINLLGRLTQDPTISYSKGEDPIAVCRFSVAVRRNQEVTDFINCVAFAGTAEMIEKYFKKGYLIGVTGALHMDKYQDKDGNSRTAATVEARSVYFADSGKNADQEEEKPAPQSRQQSNRRGGRF